MQQPWGPQSYPGRRSCAPAPVRECRKEPRSLLVVDQQQEGRVRTQLPTGIAEFVSQNAAASDLKLTDNSGMLGTEFIGGDCCVSLSVEVAPTVATAGFLVGILVVDSCGTFLAWARVEKAGTCYRVHECVISTNPGAKLTVVAVNCTARVRWCEVFSC
jgi:hypothetical protein